MKPRDIIRVQKRNHNKTDTRILFTGDLVLTNEWEDPPLGNTLYEIIQDCDLACVNLEAPLRTGEQIEKNGPVLSTEEETPQRLSKAGFNIACLANNHIMDYGYDGVERTINRCVEAGVETVGTGVNRNEAIEPFYCTQNDDEIAIYNVCQHEFGIASTTSSGTAWIDSPGLIHNIMSTSADVDLTFVVVHGGNEHVPLPSIRWQERLRELVDAGADAVIAHHPHVPQGWEIYEGQPIFYSLGNFVFDQTQYDANQWGYSVEVCVRDGTLSQTNILLVEQIGGTVRVMGQIRDPTEHYGYLNRVSDIIKKSPTNPGYWQEIAHQLYRSKYEPFFRRLGVVDPVSFYETPMGEVKRMIHLVVQYEDWSKIPEKKKMKFLNYLRAEAHHEAVITGLEVETGVVDDYRTREIELTVEDLYDTIRNGI